MSIASWSVQPDASKAEEARIRDLIDRLGRVEGLEPVVTLLEDTCERGSQNLLEPGTQVVLNCKMHATADFGVRGDITSVLPGIRAAGLTRWGPVDEKGQDGPYATGTVRYALEYQRTRGHYPDGRPMPSPRLTADGLAIDWDRLDLPLVNRIEEPAPCLSPSGGGTYHRCAQVPEGAGKGAEARARYGTVLELTVDGRDYFTVKR
ncbi:hypothetical protein BOQ63_002365 (plasmid) [Streptomyces viridifaciens]|nr:hypothetical protein BOQ63_002365 [Streptomyces viridifaciens]